MPVVTALILRTALPCSLLFTACRESNGAASRSLIQGVWQAPCLRSDAAGVYVQNQYEFLDGHRVERVKAFFTEPSCSQRFGVVAHSGVYSLEVRPEVFHYNVDMSFSAVLARVESPSGETVWNAQAFCAKTGWRSGINQDLLGQSHDECLSFGVRSIEYRDVIQVEEDVGITFGGELNHLVPRPKRVDITASERVFLLISP